ncbi:MAG: hypothetical protein ACOX5R_10540 [bacterium]|jgi:hypothetical protein
MSFLSKRQKPGIVNYSLVAALLFFSFLSGCMSVQFVSEYDEVIDLTATELQRDFTLFFIQLEDALHTGDAAYPEFKRFYDEIMADIAVLEVRANAHPRNTRTLEQVQLLKDSIRQIEAAHQEDVLNLDMIPVMHTQIEQQIGAIIRLEIAKKRGVE